MTRVVVCWSAHKEDDEDGEQASIKPYLQQKKQKYHLISHCNLNNVLLKRLEIIKPATDTLTYLHLLMAEFLKNLIYNWLQEKVKGIQIRSESKKIKGNDKIKKYSINIKSIKNTLLRWIKLFASIWAKKIFFFFFFFFGHLFCFLILLLKAKKTTTTNNHQDKRKFVKNNVPTPPLALPFLLSSPFFFLVNYRVKEKAKQKLKRRREKMKLWVRSEKTVWIIHFVWRVKLKKKATSPTDVTTQSIP